MPESELPIPTGGWRLQQVEDLGAATHECLFCRNERVRYVHVLTHPDHPPLRVGCICAEKLTGDQATPRLREKEVRNRAKRYATWADAAHWTIEEDRHTRSGRHAHWDYVVIIHRQTAGWRWLVLFADKQFRSTETLPSAEAAKYHFFSTQLD